MTPKSPDRFDLFILLLAALLARLVFVWQLQGDIPNCDEAWRMNVASFSWSEFIHAPFDETWARYIGLFPWGFLLILKGAGGWSANVMALRGLSTLLGCLLVGQVHRLVRRASDRETAFIAGLLAALHPSLLWASQEIKEFAVLACLITAGLSFALEGRRSGKQRQRITGAIFLAAAAFFHPLPAAAGWGIVLMVWFIERRRPWSEGFILGAAFLLVTLPALYHIIYASDAGHVYHQEPIQPLLFRLIGYMPFMTLRQLIPISCPPGAAYFFPPIALGALWGFWRTFRQPAHEARTSLLMAGGAWFFFLAVTWGVQIIRPTWVFTRYLVPAIPLLLMAFAMALAALPPLFRRLTAAILVVLHLGAVAIVAWSPRQNEEYREASALLEDLPANLPILWNDNPRFAVMKAVAPRNRHIWTGAADEVSPDSWTVVWRRWPGRMEIIVETATLRTFPEAWVHLNGPVLERVLRDAGLRPSGERAGLLTRYRRDLEDAP